MWNATDHVLGRAGRSSPRRHDCYVPDRDVVELEFVRAADGRVTGPALRADGRPDPQTFRGVRRITACTAARLDQLLAL